MSTRNGEHRTKEHRTTCAGHIDIEQRFCSLFYIRLFFLPILSLNHAHCASGLTIRATGIFGRGLPELQELPGLAGGVQVGKARHLAAYIEQARLQCGNR